MDKEKLIKLLKFLDETYSEYLDYENDYKYGSNKKNRDNGLRKAQNLIQNFSYIIEKDYELYELLTSEQATDYHKAIIWNELVSVQYFSRDLNNAILKVNQKIKNL